jgi:SAM-dependent methyltransferase
MKHENNSFEKYLYGEKLVGDDYSDSELEAWYRDEATAYSGLVGDRSGSYSYEYHALNYINGFRFLPSDKIQMCVGYGAATGAEFLPIQNRISNLIIIDPGEFEKDITPRNVPVRYIKPQISGRVGLEDGISDVVTCFGALHHVANVSFVVKELARILKHSGKLLLREPISNMCDWRIARPGLTPRGRGIPVKIMNEAIQVAGLEISKFSYCDFSPLRKIVKQLGVKQPHNSKAITNLVGVLSALFGWNARYHRPDYFHTFAPGSGFWVCSKGAE